MSLFPDPLAGWLLILILAAAVRCDLATRRIPNALCLTAMVLGLGLSAGSHGTEGLMYSAGGLAAGLLLLLPFYLAGGMGAGDAKLMASTGAWLGINGAILAAGLALVVGGVMAAILVSKRQHTAHLPFAPAIAAGTVLAGAFTALPFSS